MIMAKTVLDKLPKDCVECSYSYSDYSDNWDEDENMFYFCELLGEAADKKLCPLVKVTVVPEVKSV